MRENEKLYYVEETLRGFVILDTVPPLLQGAALTRYRTGAVGQCVASAVSTRDAFDKAKDAILARGALAPLYDVCGGPVSVFDALDHTRKAAQREQVLALGDLVQEEGSPNKGYVVHVTDSNYDTAPVTLVLCGAAIGVPRPVALRGRLTWRGAGIKEGGAVQDRDGDRGVVRVLDGAYAHVKYSVLDYLVVQYLAELTPA